MIKYACKNSITQQYYYPFVTHPRFKFWAYDRIRRHRALAQSKIFLQQNLGDAALTISELKEHLKNGSSDSIMKRMTAYSSNITGSDSYWYVLY